MSPATDVVILVKVFDQKVDEKLAFLTQNTAKIRKSWNITLVFKKHAIFAKNRLK
jgi:hypothetical protein